MYLPGSGDSTVSDGRAPTGPGLGIFLEVAVLCLSLPTQDVNPTPTFSRYGYADPPSFMLFLYFTSEGCVMGFA